MKLAVRHVLFILILVLMLFIISCAPSVEVDLAKTPEPTISVMATPTPTPTITPSPLPTATPIFNEERTAILNQQIQDFLNREGEFTPEKISQMMIEFYDGNGIDHKSRNDMSAAGLGISSYQPHVQGYFFDYYVKDGKAILLMGFDGEDGNRFVTPVEMPFYLLDALETATFFVEKSSVNNIDGIDYSIQNRTTVQYHECVETIYCQDRTSLLEQLDLLKGNVIAIVPNILEHDVSILDGMDLAETNYNRAAEYINESNSKIGLSYGLMELVISNDIDYKSNIENITNIDRSSITRIEEVRNIDNIDFSRVPITAVVFFFDGILN